MKHETNFVVFPEHANCLFPMIFGGAFFSELDKAAAICVRRLLYESQVSETAVTHKFEGVYHKPCYVGDFIVIQAEVVSLGKKSVVVETKAYREKQDSRELVAEAKFVFVSIYSAAVNVESKPDLLPYCKHGLGDVSDG